MTPMTPMTPEQEQALGPQIDAVRRAMIMGKWEHGSVEHINGPFDCIPLGCSSPEVTAALTLLIDAAVAWQHVKDCRFDSERCTQADLHVLAERGAL